MGLVNKRYEYKRIYRKDYEYKRIQRKDYKRRIIRIIPPEAIQWT
jgi:hypothetical protein